MLDSSYSIEDCGVYKESFYDIGIPVYIFESHNLALPAWGVTSNKMGKALNLLTFDTHNDTRAPFTRMICENGGNPDDGINNPVIHQELKKYRYQVDDFLFEDVFKLSYLIVHDEQIKTAYDFKYLKSYCIVHRNDADGYEEYDNYLGYQCKYYDDRRIDWNRLSCIEEPLALDFDLDYFVKHDDLDDKFENNIQPLVNKASVITIAKEVEHFEREKKEPSFTNDEALKMLVDIIRSCR